MTVCLDVARAARAQSVPVSFYGGEQAIFAKSERAHATAPIPVYMRGLAIDPGEYGQVWYVDVPLQVYSTPRFVLQTAVCPYGPAALHIAQCMGFILFVHEPHQRTNLAQRTFIFVRS